MSVRRDGPSLALLADHDDGDREFCYAGAAGTVAEAGPITDVAPPARLDHR